MKRKHCDLIIAWANGAEIQFKENDGWTDWIHRASPAWTETTEYRIKPEPKPDVVFFGSFFLNKDGEGEISLTIDKFLSDEFKFVFDGESLKPKSVEILNKEVKQHKE